MSYTPTNTPTDIPEDGATFLPGTNPQTTLLRTNKTVEQRGNDLVINFGDGRPARTIKNYLAGRDSEAQASKLAGLNSSVSVESPPTDDGKPVVKGTAADDLIHGGDTAVRIDGEAGDDIIEAETGADELWGGRGRDWLYGGAGNDELSGGIGDDELHGEAGNDELSGGVGNDELHGEAGNDELYGGFGDDKLFGEAGDDLLSGGVGDDKLNGGVGDDRLEGGPGSDVLHGGEGADDMKGATGNDTLHGGEGSDTLSGDDGKDYLYGDAGNDRIYGGAGNDLLFGGAGNDLLVGGTGIDTLYGEEGNDFLSGGAGNDTYYYRRGDGHDWISNRGDDNDQDVMLFADGVDIEQLWFRRVDNDLQVTLVGTEDGVTFGDWYVDARQRVHELRLNNGGPVVHYLDHSGIQTLVDAMARFSPPPVGSTDLPANYQTELSAPLAAAWKF
ncbi:calcium-binding protein [Herbaspirillum sp. alder98]|uniref:calcium-binding protein n=1 Tax=Herbaspirillum sp. alder98 TaxID=2913096 RepID=UPI001CD8A93C|nr:calcium-binding protein [Herbaspirillum sp. alder98]MCA1323185.1 hypothetical protein [Herbaspirillum sp. alder98]